MGHDHGHGEAEEGAVHHHVVMAGRNGPPHDDPGEPRNGQPGIAEQQRRRVVAPQALAADQPASDIITQQPERHEQCPSTEEPVAGPRPQQRGHRC